MVSPGATELRLRIETFAATKGSTWFTSAECQRYAECTHHAAKTQLTELVKTGKLESSSRKGYRMRSASAQPADHDEVQYPKNEDASTGPVGAAPGPSLPEQPAAVPSAAPVPAPQQEPAAAGPPPLGVAARQDAELRVIAEIIAKVESLGGRETRQRVVAYVTARFL